MPPTSPPAHARRPLSAWDLLAQVEQSLEDYRDQAKRTWTPGQVFGEILAYLETVETWPDTGCTSDVRDRMSWLGEVLANSVSRSIAIGLDPARLNSLADALHKHADVLSTTGRLASSDASAARELIRLEIAYLQPLQRPSK